MRIATFYLVLLQNWPRAGKEKAKGAFNLRSSCEIKSIFQKAIYSTQSLSAHHTHLPIYISPFHFLSFLSSKVSQAMCSRENSLGHVICRAEWIPPCALAGSSLLTCLLPSMSLTSFLLLVRPSGLSFLFHSLCQPASKDDLKSSCDTWKALLSQHAGHSKPAETPNASKQQRAAEIISAPSAPVAGVAHSKVLRIKKSDIQKIRNQTE